VNANVTEGFAYLALATRSDTAVSTAWVAHVFASDADNTRFAAELWAVRR
jgi:hypothetical protein